ncbi:hypothetical protein KIH39_04250 [Telmatocola sphagniphila]|uniref:Uncharacterized protein n=1 Tax=Telmatocola sphagniphila TaxID=1123043 RepID=A0A8E6B6R5_9BACT|nr:hypothetical protein [Telmatocola sphagniphila]QVL33135.1 hypothetical protein KIH39_04250 [Telmatocola sphagniphila]
MQSASHIYLRSDRTQKLKDFAGYQKGHRLPERIDAYSKRYLGEIGQGELKAEMDRVFNLLRNHYSYKRKELESSISPEGEAVIHTPAFSYRVSLHLDETDLTRAIVKRELSPEDLESIKKPAFELVFPKMFDTLLVEWEEPLDLIALIDRLEDDPIANTKMTISSDNSYMDLNIGGFPGVMRLEAKTLEITGLNLSAVSMLEQFAKFQAKVQPEGN